MDCDLSAPPRRAAGHLTQRRRENKKLRTRAASGYCGTRPPGHFDATRRLTPGTRRGNLARCRASRPVCRGPLKGALGWAVAARMDAYRVCPCVDTSRIRHRLLPLHHTHTAMRLVSHRCLAAFPDATTALFFLLV